MASKKNIKMVEKATVLEYGDIMKPLDLVSAKDGLRATLLMMMKHVADVHVAVLEIIGEKYNLDVDEMCNTVKDDKRFQDILKQPILTDLLSEVKPLEKPEVHEAEVEKAEKPKKQRKPMSEETKAAAAAKRKATREKNKAAKEVETL
jgi:DNA-binding HxlR family transcriptional regulator